MTRLGAVLLGFLISGSLFAQSANNGDFILVRGGTFIMGSPASEANRGKDETQHPVSVSDFYMGKHELTQREYRGLIGANPSAFKGDELPVESVSWFDAVRYCNARSAKEDLERAYTIEGQKVIWNRRANGYRLPTEAEWEYACRAGTKTAFNTPKYISARQANYYGTYPYTIEQHYFAQSELQTPPGEYRERTVPEASLPPNPWSLYEMHGNVGEWCWDWYGSYEAGPQNDPAGPDSGSYRVSRGGAWNDFGKNLRSAYRAPANPESRQDIIGFRLVRNAH